MAEINRQYYDLNPDLRRSLKNIANIYAARGSMRGLENLTPLSKKATLIQLLRDVDIGTVLDDKQISTSLYCYRAGLEADYDEGASEQAPLPGSFRITEGIMTGRNVIVLAGKITVSGYSRNVVVKWSRRGDVRREMYIYNRLRGLGCPLPWYSDEYQILGEPVLVMQRLSRLGHTDNPLEVGIQVLQQLLYLHKIGVHSDLKPMNILKDDSCKEPTYYIIDYGGVSTERMYDGFVRRTWTQTWTSQPMHTGRAQFTCATFDFRELGHVLRALDIWQEESETVRVNEKDVRRGYKDQLAQYHRYVMELPEKHSINERANKDLQIILSS